MRSAGRSPNPRRGCRAAAFHTHEYAADSNCGASGPADQPHPRRRRVRSRAARCFGLRQPSGGRSMVHAPIPAPPLTACTPMPSASPASPPPSRSTPALLMLLLVPMQAPPPPPLPETGTVISGSCPSRVNPSRHRSRCRSPSPQPTHADHRATARQPVHQDDRTVVVDQRPACVDRRRRSSRRQHRRADNGAERHRCPACAWNTLAPRRRPIRATRCAKASQGTVLLQVLVDVDGTSAGGRQSSAAAAIAGSTTPHAGRCCDTGASVRR